MSDWHEKKQLTIILRMIDNIQNNVEDLNEFLAELDEGPAVPPMFQLSLQQKFTHLADRLQLIYNEEALENEPF